MNTRLLYALIFISAQASYAQVEIGTGTGTSTSYPIATLNNSSASESIYLGTETGTGNITKLAYYKGSGTSTAEPSVRIYMKTTSATTVGNNNYAVGATAFAEYTLVYDGGFTNNATSGWMEVTLTTPFSITSTSQNLSVLVVNSTAISSGRPQYRYTSMTPTPGVRRTSYYSSGTAWTAASTMTVAWERPNIRLTLVAPVSCSAATFPSSVSAVASKTSICSSESINFSLSASMPGATGITYQWRSSPDNISYTNAGSASSSSSATLAASASAKWFRCEVLCNGSVVLTSAPVQVSLLSEVISTAPGSRTGTGTVNIGATGATGNTLTWYADPSGGSPIGTGSPFTTPSISTSTTYYVSASGPGPAVHVGPATPNAVGTRGSNNQEAGIRFTSANATTLRSVTIYPFDAASDDGIILRDASENVLQEITFAVPPGHTLSTTAALGAPLVVDLNWSIAANTEYRLYWKYTWTGANRTLRNTDGAGAWYNVSNNGITFTGNTGLGTGYWYWFYDWVFASSCSETARVAVLATVNPSPLPVTLADFEVSTTDHRTVLVSWKTYSEASNDYFVVESSADGEEFKAVAQVKGAGNSHAPLHYQVSDPSPQPGVQYYRLKQVDFDGKFTYSDLRSLYFSVNTEGVNLFPNPAADGATLTVETSESGRIYVQVSTPGGKIVETHEEERAGGINTFAVGKGLVPGIYSVSVRNGEGVSENLKFVVSH